MKLLEKLVVAFLLGWTSEAHAIELPQSIFDSLSSRLQFGQCQQEFLSSVDMYKELKTSDPQQTLILIPCAQWAHNLRWLVYLAITDSESSENVNFVKPFFFTHRSAYKGLHSSEYIENYKWNGETQTLFSRNFPNGNTQCGEMVLYKYNSQQQDFQMTSLIYNDDCSNLEASWEELVSQ